MSELHNICILNGIEKTTKAGFFCFFMVNLKKDAIQTKKITELLCFFLQ